MSRGRMRMAELSRLSGVPRETIHFYLREGLLPAPEKGGKTVAYYDDAHLERLRLIRQLRDEKYLPVAVIRSILQAGLQASPGSDVDTLADVLRIDPTLARAPAVPAPDEEARRVAAELGLVEPERDDPDDPSTSRVLGAVGQALALDGSARELTLDDMRVSAPELRRLVEAEAAAFFDLVIRRGDMPGGVRALREGRPAVARFITAFRDSMLRHIIDDLLGAIRHAPERIGRARALPLGEARLERLGAEAHRLDLLTRARRGDAAAANDLVWQLFAVGPSRELLRLPQAVLSSLRPRAELLVAHASVEREGGDPSRMQAILSRAGAFALGEILLGEIELIRGVEPGAGGGVLERAVPALHRMTATAPDTDADPLASALALLRRGLVGLALPAVLGRAEHARADLDAALSVVLGAPGRLHPAAHARIEGNARLALGRLLLGAGRLADAREQLGRAADVDPAGPLGAAARGLLGEA